MPRRHTSGLPEPRRRSFVDGGTTPPLSPPIEAPSFYSAGVKANTSSIFGGYVGSIRSGRSSRRSGYSTPGTGTPHGSDTEDIGYVTSPHSKRTKRKKAEVFVRNLEVVLSF